MVWAIIALVLQVAFGPILYLIPSRRDRRLARVRQQARLVGFVIEMRPVRQTNPEALDRVSAGGEIRIPTHQSMAYTLVMPAKLEVLIPGRVLLDPQATDPAPGWQLDEGAADWLRDNPTLLDALPEDVVGVEVGARKLTCYWLEKAPAAEAEVDALKDVMDDVIQWLVDRDTQQRDDADGDEFS